MRRRLPTVLALVALAVAVGVAAALLAGRNGGGEATGEDVTTTVVTQRQPSATSFDVTAATQGVVSIVVTSSSDEGFGPQESTGSGSGFVLDRSGRIVTNDHVVEGASAIHVSFADGTKVDARLLATDPLLDLAVIKVNVPATTLHPLQLGQAERLALGDPLVAIGNPFGLDRSVSVGIVSALRRQITAPNGFTVSNAIQTDAAINHGNSGGPLLDGGGRVVGVNAQIADSGVNANVGVGFAVALDAPTRAAVRLLAQGKTVEHAWLGVSLDEIDSILATSGDVRSDAGALVTGIVPGGPADDAGMRGGSQPTAIEGAEYCLGGDIVVSADGAAVSTVGDLQRVITAAAPGATLRLGLIRADGSRKTVPVELGRQPTSAPSSVSGCG